MEKKNSANPSSQKQTLAIEGYQRLNMTLLIPGASTVLNAKISPVVIYSICDSFLRRNEGQDRVIGILLGSIDSNGTCHVRSCFTVIHSEQDGEASPQIAYISLYTHAHVLILCSIEYSCTFLIACYVFPFTSSKRVVHVETVDTITFWQTKLISPPSPPPSPPTSSHARTQVAVDVLHQKTLLGLHQRVSRKDVMVGWFSTGASVRAIDVILQNFYREECSNPIHLTLDVELIAADPSIVRTYISRQVGLGERALATEFVEIPNEVLMGEALLIGFDTAAAVVSEPLPSDAEALQRSADRLQKLLDTMCKYVDDVCVRLSCPVALSLAPAGPPCAKPNTSAYGSRFVAFQNAARP